MAEHDNYNHWDTASFTSLDPGWFNFYTPSGHGPTREPCPGVLVLEQRVGEEGEWMSDEPYTGRAVPAVFRHGLLVPASSIPGYIGTGTGRPLPEEAFTGPTGRATDD